MVSSISSTAQDSIQLMMAQMMKKMSAADTDGTTGLSKDELSSIDTSSDAGGSAFLKSLTDQFDELDTDGNGQLSSSEISAAKPPSGGQMGPPPGLDIGSSDDSSDTTSSSSSSSSTGSSDSSDSTTSASSLIEELLQKLVMQMEEKFEQMASSSSGSSSNPAEQTISSLTSNSDTDGMSGLSKDELSAVDTSSDPGEAKFVNDLVSNFDSLDTNGDGQLSSDEMKGMLKNNSSATANATDVASQVNLTSSDSSSTDPLKSMENLTMNFIKKLVSAYESGSTSSLTSVTA